ncbi:reverse transcriptase domain-containing protein, partial [Tanacetum coccineum]
IMAAYEVPPSPDYIPGPEVPPLPDYIPGLEEPQSPPPLDFPLPTAAASPTVDSPGYVPESDPEEEPEEDDEDPEEDPADYLADRDDDDEEEKEEEPSGDDADDEEEEEEEEHPAPGDSVAPVHRMTVRISIRDEPSISLPPMEEVERLLALTTPPPSPLTPLSSPLPQIPSPPFPASPPASVLPASPPASPIRPLGYRAAMIRLRAETPSTPHPLPLPTSSSPLQLLSSDRRADRPEITLPPWKRLGIDLGLRREVGESLSTAAARMTGGRNAEYGFVGTMDTEIRRQRAEEVGYGIRDVWVDPREAVEEVAPMTLEGVNTRVTELTAVQEQDTQDIYAVIRDTQDRQTHIFETLVDASQYHYETAPLLDQEALVSREAWGSSIEVSYMTRLKIMALRSIVMGQQAVISQLQAADRRSQAMNLEMLQADHRRQAEIAALQTFDCTRQEQLVQTLTLMQSLQGQKMAPKRTTRARPAPETTTTTTSVTNAQLQAMINQGVTAALAARDATRNGDGNHTSGTGVRRTERVAREIETVFRISNCSVDNQIKLSTCTLLAGALTWWNSHVRIVGQDVAYAMTWTDLRKKMTDKYYLRNEMKKLEVELWNLKVKGTDVTRYNQQFQD